MKRILAIVALMALLAIGCGGSFDRQEAIDDLVESGITQDQASCMVDEMVVEFGEDKLASNDDLSDGDEEKLTAIAFGCLGAN